MPLWGLMAADPIEIADRSAVTNHINILQAAIKRMADNSAASKGWCLTLVSALLGLAGAAHVAGIATTALVPVVVFGFLDAMYLGQEKAYRDLYNSVVKKIQAGSYAPADLFDMRAPFTAGHFWRALRSWSIFPVYLGLIAIYVVAKATGWIDLLAVVPPK